MSDIICLAGLSDWQQVYSLQWHRVHQTTTYGTLCKQTNINLALSYRDSIKTLWSELAPPNATSILMSDQLSLCMCAWKEVFPAYLCLYWLCITSSHILFAWSHLRSKMAILCDMESATDLVIRIILSVLFCEWGCKIKYSHTLSAHTVLDKFDLHCD